jgi:Flp pilus assembly protein TadG
MVASMCIDSLLQHLRNRLRTFSGCQRGNVMFTFALALVPIIGLVGAAVDYSRGNSARTAMQSAVDAAALILSKEAQKLSTADLNTKADAVFRAQFHRPDVTNLVVTPHFVDSGNGSYKLTLGATATVPTSFTKVIGHDQMNLTVASDVVWGLKKLELVLALDVTGSMDSNNKMTELKKAAKSLLTTMQKAAKKDGDIKVAIIPFAVVVNAGAANVNADSLDWSDWMSEPAILDPGRSGAKPKNWDRVGPGTNCPFTNNNHGFRCTNGPGSKSNGSTVSTIPTNGTYAGLICPSMDNGNKDTASTGLLSNRYYSGCYTSTEKPAANWHTVDSGSGASCGSTPNCSCSGSGSNKVCKQKTYDHEWRPSPKTAWDGCVRDRNQTFDAQNTVPSFVGTNVATTNINGQQESYRTATTPSTADAFQPFQYATCPAALQPLTSNWTALENKINELSPSGNTNVTIGLSWAFQALTVGNPLNTAAVPSEGLKKVIILLTDGDNTQNRWTNSGTDIDLRTQQACANIRALDNTVNAIDLWTIRVINGNAKLLQACASKPDMYKNVQDAAQLNVVFDEIARALTNLRIAK